MLLSWGVHANNGAAARPASASLSRAASQNVGVGIGGHLSRWQRPLLGTCRVLFTMSKDDKNDQALGSSQVRACACARARARACV